MLFLAISSPAPQRPSTVAARRRAFWRWLAPLCRTGECRSIYARAGRGAVAVFDVASNERLHALLTQWSEFVPASFEVLPLVDAGAARRALAAPRRRAARDR